MHCLVHFDFGCPGKCAKRCISTFPAMHSGPIHRARMQQWRISGAIHHRSQSAEMLRPAAYSGVLAWCRSATRSSPFSPHASRESGRGANGVALCITIEMVASAPDLDSSGAHEPARCAFLTSISCKPLMASVFSPLGEELSDRITEHPRGRSALPVRRSHGRDSPFAATVRNGL